MELRRFGPLDREVPVVGLGTYDMERDARRSVRALLAGIEAGMTHIDTAEMYGAGKVEKVVADAIASARDRVFLASKVLPSNASYAGTIRACEESLRRLKTDHLDLYLLHWRSVHPLAETIRAFEALKESGMIRAYGVSNFGVAELEEAVRLAGDRKIACNQVQYHLEDRGIESSLLPWCQAHDVAVVGYSPFGQQKTAWSSPPGIEVLEAIGRDHGVTPHAVALRFLVRQPGTFAIPKSSNPDHVVANGRAGELLLSPEELERIDRAFPLRAAA